MSGVSRDRVGGLVDSKSVYGDSSVVDALNILSGSARFDAFSRLRVSNPVTIFDSQSQYDAGLKDAFFHDITGAASAAHNHDECSVTLTTTTGATDAIVRQTQRYFRYQPGKSQLIFCTFDFQANDGGTKEVGYGDDDNGIFFRMDASGNLSLFKMSKQTGSAAESEVEQANWSVDVFDGTGVSGITLDATKAQILVVDLQWLAVGRVRVGFDINGIICYAHEFLWANVDSGVYMSTANLPIRYKLVGNGSITNLEAICCSVSSEGGFVHDLGHEHVTPAGTTGISCATGSETFIAAIRPKALFNTYANRGEYIPTAISFYVTGNAVLIRSYHGGTVTGGSWVSSDAESGVEYNITATTSGGHLTTGEYGAAAGGGKAFQTAGGSDTQNRLFLVLDMDAANTDEGNYTVVGQGIGGTAVVYCNIHWTEIK